MADTQPIERVRELATALETAEPPAFSMDDAASDLRILLTHYEAMREALRFYAADRTWQSVTAYMCGHGAIDCMAMSDKGNKARQALNQDPSILSGGGVRA